MQKDNLVEQVVQSKIRWTSPNSDFRSPLNMLRESVTSQESIEPFLRNLMGSSFLKVFHENFIDNFYVEAN